eukprot:gene23210-1921_t
MFTTNEGLRVQVRAIPDERQHTTVPDGLATEGVDRIGGHVVI